MTHGLWSERTGPVHLVAKRSLSSPRFGILNSFPSACKRRDGMEDGEVLMDLEGMRAILFKDHEENKLWYHTLFLKGEVSSSSLFSKGARLLAVAGPRWH